MLDGEVVVIGPGGKPGFQDLRRELGKHSGKLRYYAFDLLELNGRRLQPLRLIERKALLEKVLNLAPDTIRYVEHFDNDAHTVIVHACGMLRRGMKSVELYGQVRHAVRIDGLSRREVGRRFGD